MPKQFNSGDAIFHHRTAHRFTSLIVLPDIRLLHYTFERYCACCTCSTLPTILDSFFSCFSATRLSSVTNAPRTVQYSCRAQHNAVWGARICCVWGQATHLMITHRRVVLTCLFIFQLWRTVHHMLATALSSSESSSRDSMSARLSVAANSFCPCFWHGDGLARRFLRASRLHI